jgi:hypothetical protein
MGCSRSQLTVEGVYDSKLQFGWKRETVLFNPSSKVKYQPAACNLGIFLPLPLQQKKADSRPFPSGAVQGPVPFQLEKVELFNRLRPVQRPPHSPTINRCRPELTVWWAVWWMVGWDPMHGSPMVWVVEFSLCCETLVDVDLLLSRVGEWRQEGRYFKMNSGSGFKILHKRKMYFRFRVYSIEWHSFGNWHGGSWRRLRVHSLFHGFRATVNSPHHLDFHRAQYTNQCFYKVTGDK